MYFWASFAAPGQSAKVYAIFRLEEAQYPVFRVEPFEVLSRGRRGP